MKLPLYFWFILVLLAGALLPIQAGWNTKLAKVIESSVYASLISFAVGTLTLIIYVLITRQHVSFESLKSVPVYAWLGGVLGAFYVTIIVLAFPKIGPALTFGLIIAGQLLIAVVLEHFNILVAQQHSINIWRILGILLIMGGVVLIRKF